MDGTQHSAHPSTADTAGYRFIALVVGALMGTAGTLFYIWLIGGLHWVLACR